MLERLWESLELPKRKCRGITAKDERCERHVKLLYCRDHRPLFIKVCNILLIILILAAGIVSQIETIHSFYHIYWGGNKDTSECNQFSGGCALDLSTDENIFYDPHAYKYKWKGVNPPFQLNYSCGDFNSGVPFFKGSVKNFPIYPSLSHRPYGIQESNGKLLIYGTIEDYKSNLTLGYFDWNSFEINTDKDGGCAYSYNMDKYGIEVVNRDREVCFALDLSKNKWRMNGYVVDLDDTIHVFNGLKYIKTIDPKEARKEISKIEKIFVHSKRFDSKGRELIDTLGERHSYLNGNPSYPFMRPEFTPSGISDVKFFK